MRPFYSPLLSLAAFALATLATLTATPTTRAAGDIAIEAKVTGNVAVLQAKCDGKTVVWIVPEGLTQPVPVDAFRDTKISVLMGKPGIYKVTAISALVDKPIFGDVSFTLTGPEPPPFVPPLPPGPLPPGPGPLPPGPIDDLPIRLKAAYLAETSPAKRGQLVNLTGIYAAMADCAEKDKDVVTSLQLLDVLGKVKAGMLMDGVLMDLRRIATNEVALVVGPPGPTPYDRVRVAATFRRIVKSLPTPE